MSRPTPRENDTLFQLERKIARRADEIAHQFGVDRSRTLDPWRQAEREIWERELTAATSAPARQSA